MLCFGDGVFGSWFFSAVFFVFLLGAAFGPDAGFPGALLGFLALGCFGTGPALAFRVLFVGPPPCLLLAFGCSYLFASSGKSSLYLCGATY